MRITNNRILSTAGAVQGIITGIRGLCNGLGPALFGLMFFIFHVDLDSPKPGSSVKTNSTSTKISTGDPSLRVSTNYILIETNIISLFIRKDIKDRQRSFRGLS
jgi:hypothetical protein